jgi:hypothetical protein
MNCNYDCDESPSLSSNDCLMKDVTVLMCSGVDGLSIFVCFSSWFNSRKFEYVFSKYWYKMFRLLVFLLHSKKKWNSSSKTLQIAHSLWSLGILRFLPISIKSLCSLRLNFVKISLTFLSGSQVHGDRNPLFWQFFFSFEVFFLRVRLITLTYYLPSGVDNINLLSSECGW